MYFATVNFCLNPLAWELVLITVVTITKKQAAIPVRLENLIVKTTWISIARDSLQICKICWYFTQNLHFTNRLGSKIKRFNKNCLYSKYPWTLNTEVFIRQSDGYRPCSRHWSSDVISWKSTAKWHADISSLEINAELPWRCSG